MRNLLDFRLHRDLSHRDDGAPNVDQGREPKQPENQQPDRDETDPEVSLKGGPRVYKFM